MYAKIAGCNESHGNVEVGYSFFLEPDDKRYNERYYLVPVIPLTGYPGKVDDEGNPLDQEEYEAWISSLPHIYQLAPFHNHFVHFDPDVTLEQIQAVATFHQPNFYAAWLQELDKIKGGMRKGWDVETRQRPIRYDRIDPERHAIRKPQCLEKVELIKALSLNVKSKDIGETFPATEITMGEGASDMTDTFNLSYTCIDLNNPADGTGSIDTIEIWMNGDGGNTYFGTFYLISGTTYKCRDSVNLEVVTAGSKQTFSGKDVSVSTDDVPGAYNDEGYSIERDKASHSNGIRYVNGEYIDPNDEVDFSSSQSDDAISIYGTGETVGASYEKALTEAIALADTIIKGSERTFSDVTSLADTLVKGIGLSFSDVTSLADTVQKATGKVLTDAVTLVESFTRVGTIKRAFSDTLSILDTPVYRTRIAISEVLSLVDTVARATKKSISNSLQIADTVVRGVKKTITNALTIIDVIKVVGAEKAKLTEILIIGDTVVRKISKAFSDNVTVADSIVKKSTRTLTDALSILDSPINKISLAVSDALTLVDFFSRTTQIKRAFTETVTIADSLVKASTRALSDALTVVDSFIKVKTYQIAVIDIITLADNISSMLTKYRNLSVKVAMHSYRAVKPVMHLYRAVRLLMYPRGEGG